MKKRQWIMLVIVTVALSLLVKTESQTSAAPKGPLPETAQREQALNQAITNLSSLDQLTRRNAGREIAKLSNPPGIQRAINPLIEATTDAEQTDGIVNRSIYVGALGAICRQIGTPVN